VVIVDDVVTTGSTVKALTRALNRAGIERVDVISFARVVPGAEPADGLAAAFAGTI
jgi:adenine/guanine phosphoribosyltransferase-like PRPP-binding protein